MTSPRTTRSGPTCRRRLTRHGAAFAMTLVLAGHARSPVAARHDGTPDAAFFPVVERWAVELSGQPGQPPIVTDGVVVVAIERARVDAFSLGDGKARWSADEGATLQPAAGGGLVFVPTLDGLDARDAVTGTARWHAPLGPLASPPRWRGGWLLIGLADGRFLGLRGADGATVWTRDLGAPAHAVASIEGERAYVPLQDGRIEALRIETGEPLWEIRLPQAGVEMLALPDRVYVGSLDNNFYCLAARDGAIAWRWRTGADVVGGAAVDTSRVYFTSLDTEVRALDRRSGVQRWHRSLPTRPIDAPAIAGSALFAPMIAPELLFYPLDERANPVRIELPDDLYVASRLDPPRDGGTLLVVTVAPSGRATLRAFGRAPDLAVTPLTAVPGTPLEPPALLPPVTEPPGRSLALPEWRPRGV